MLAFYNEIDRYCARELIELAEKRQITDGDISCASITEIAPRHVTGYTEAHFFAGIGVWARAIRDSDWPWVWTIWSGSCPCQPFSIAGARKGADDSRHLWPVWRNLIGAVQPFAIVGEQVDSPEGVNWISNLQADLAREGYVVGFVVLPAAGYGAANARHRIFWVAYPDGSTPEGARKLRDARGLLGSIPEEPAGSGNRRLACAGSDGQQGGLRGRQDSEWQTVHRPSGPRRSDLRLVDGRWERWDGGRPTGDAELHWLRCLDGKWRPIKPGIVPLVDGYPGRVAAVRAYGNAINLKVATEFMVVAREMIEEAVYAA